MMPDGNSSNVTTPSAEDAEGGIDWHSFANKTFMIVDPIITFGGIIGKLVYVYVFLFSAVDQHTREIGIFALVMPLECQITTENRFIHQYEKTYNNSRQKQANKIKYICHICSTSSCDSQYQPQYIGVNHIDNGLAELTETRERQNVDVYVILEVIVDEVQDKNHDIHKC